jgi:hypothetical protein
MWKAVEIKSEGLRTWTQGLNDHGLHDLTVEVADTSLLPEAEALLRNLAAYMTSEGVRVEAEETLAYGYWAVQVREEQPAGRFELWEYNADATRFVPGANITLNCWRDQHEVCERYGAEFSPPQPNQLVVISDGVLRGDAVQGVRYPSPEHMSGWWITTDRYDGDIRSLTQEHLYHLTAARPDLARYLALPFGFRLDQANDEAVWFDEKVAREEP